MPKIEELTSTSTIQNFMNEHEFSFLYITRTNCGVCNAILPQLQELLDKFPLIHLGRVNVDNVEEVAAELSILTVPVLILFVNGKEFLRAARFVHFAELEKRINKIYGMYNQ